MKQIVLQCLSGLIGLNLVLLGACAFDEGSDYKPPPFPVANPQQLSGLPGRVLYDDKLFAKSYFLDFKSKGLVAWEFSDNSTHDPTDTEVNLYRDQPIQTEPLHKVCTAQNLTLLRSDRGVWITQAHSELAIHVDKDTEVYRAQWSPDCQYLLYSSRARIKSYQPFLDGEQVWWIVLSVKDQTRFVLFRHPYLAGAPVVWVQE